ncbi:MAG: anti-sigma factor [Phycisphaerales bacterium]|nr:anti-sigma factor [Phycisphaerales bacterium]MCB9840029.1 anti-sigma factor [Phycisphaeraceae bacterium]
MSHFSPKTNGLDHETDGATLELIAAQVLDDISLDEKSSLSDAPVGALAIDEASLEAAAGSLFLALAQQSAPVLPDAIGGDTGAGSSDAMPGDVRRRLDRLAEAFIAARQGEPVRVIASPIPAPTPAATPKAQKPAAASPTRTNRLAPAIPLWSKLAMAAAVAIAALGWWVALSGPADPGGFRSPAEVLVSLRDSADTVRLDLGEWSDESVTAEIKDVSGSVTWSDQAQCGVLTLHGLPELRDSVYQLWIIDAERGMSQRISGAIFQSDGKDTAVVIDPRLPVNRAAAFALTIEQPGGTWVSDMSRRVVIAARQ